RKKGVLMGKRPGFPQKSTGEGGKTAFSPLCGKQCGKGGKEEYSPKEILIVKEKDAVFRQKQRPRSFFAQFIFPNG
ncbi:MAG: hypothetical protein IKK98_05125, partial [Oscillospiraceae bacterium]|nr:hypothetical protein [Oscillospiraceae bacterium]